MLLSSSGVFGKADAGRSDDNSSAYLQEDYENSQNLSGVCEVDVLKLSPSNAKKRAFKIPQKVANNFVSRMNNE